MNNLKAIRELYGATQDAVATALGVNRVTVANWENSNSVPSSSNREKLSLYYGIGPEYFFAQPLDEHIRGMVIQSGMHAKQIAEESAGERNKEIDFHRAFESITFSDALKRYMLSTKMLLVAAEGGDLESLETARLVNSKLGSRLDMIIQLKKAEESEGGPSLRELMGRLRYGEDK